MRSASRRRGYSGEQHTHAKRLCTLCAHASLTTRPFLLLALIIAVVLCPGWAELVFILRSGQLRREECGECREQVMPELYHMMYIG